MISNLEVLVITLKVLSILRNRDQQRVVLALSDLWVCAVCIVSSRLQSKKTRLRRGVSSAGRNHVALLGSEGLVMPILEVEYLTE